LFAAAGIAGALALVGAPAFAQSGCAALCAVTCVKPISIPDRWDDATPIAGYTGSIPPGKRPNWRLNNVWDHEDFSDLNSNGLWDEGESFTDGNTNGVYDAEAYDPLATGYVADSNPLSPAGDIGLMLTIKFDNDSKATPAQFCAIDLPPLNRGTPLDGVGPYQAAWAGCIPTPVGLGDVLQLQPGNLVGTTTPIFTTLAASDPGAHWDPTTRSVEGSAAAQSPRVIFLAVHDPRIPIRSGFNNVVVTKVIAFFIEQDLGNSTVSGRLVRAIGSGEACASNGAGFIVECPTPARGTSWGRVKDLYR